MDNGPSVLNYEPRIGSGLRWGYIVAAGCILVVSSGISFFTQLAFALIAGRGVGLASYLFLSVLPSVVSGLAAIAVAVLLALSHYAPPRGEGMSRGRMLAVILACFCFILSMSGVALNIWAFLSEIRLPPIVVTMANAIFFMANGTWLAVLVAICLYMRRVSLLSGCSMWGPFTFIAAAISAIPHLVHLGLYTAHVPPYLAMGPPGSLRIYVPAALGAVSAINIFVYGAAIAYLAWIAARRERRVTATAVS